MSWISNELLPVLHEVWKEHKVDITDKASLVDHLKKKHKNEKAIIGWASKATDRDLKDALKYVKRMHREKNIKKMAVEILSSKTLEISRSDLKILEELTSKISRMRELKNYMESDAHSYEQQKKRLLNLKNSTNKSK